MANTGKDASGTTIFLRSAFGTGVDDTNAYNYGSAVYFSRNGAEQLAILDTTTPANNRGLPVVLLSGPASAPFDTNIGAAAATTLRTIEAKKTFSRYRNTALSSTKQEIKASAGDIYSWNFINPNTVDVFVKLYDAPAASVTVGTTTPALTLQIPAASSGSFGSFWQDVGVHPQEIFTSGITIAVVTSLADSSTTAPSTAIHCSVRFI